MHSRSLSSSSSLLPVASSTRICMVVIGPGGVGKSSLSMQYVQGIFVSTYDPTIMDSLMKTDSIDGVGNAVVTLVDTAGQEVYAEHRTLYIRTADVCVLVYSITDPQSLADASRTFDQALTTRPTKRLPFLLVANKADLSSQRHVTTEQGRRLAVTLASRMNLSSDEMLAAQQDPPFLEVTATAYKDAQNVFHTAARMVKRFRDCNQLGAIAHAPPPPPPPSALQRRPSTSQRREDSQLKQLASSFSHHDDGDDDGDFSTMLGGVDVLVPAAGRTSAPSSPGYPAAALDPVLVLPEFNAELTFAQHAPASPLDSAADLDARKKKAPKKKKKKNGRRCVML